MSDCPHCDWRYDHNAACVLARQVGVVFPLIYKGGVLRLASGVEAIDAKASAAGWHICTEHPQEPEVRAFGPIETYEPLSALAPLL